MVPTRRAVLLLPAILSPVLLESGCADDPAPEAFTPFRYDFLTPIRLNVASIEIERRFVPDGSRRDETARAPVEPASALRQMAQDRLQALGAAGRAVFVITDASLSRTGDSYQGNFVVELDVYADGAVRSGFADARVFRRRDDADGDERTILYDLTKQLMDAMNVEFEFQVRQRLKDYITTGTAPAPAPVQQQELAPPS
jgi:hypothetical protein